MSKAVLNRKNAFRKFRQEFLRKTIFWEFLLRNLMNELRISCERGHIMNKCDHRVHKVLLIDQGIDLLCDHTYSLCDHT